MDDFEKELKTDFLEEATELLDESEQYFLELESSSNRDDLLNKIFRFAHNLKGTSRAVGFGDVAEFTHEFENLILKLKEGEAQVTDHIVSLLLKCNDHVGHMITELKNDIEATFDSAQLIKELVEAQSSSADAVSVETQAEPEPVESAAVDELPKEDESFDGETFDEADVELLKALDAAEAEIDELEPVQPHLAEVESEGGEEDGAVEFDDLVEAQQPTQDDTEVNEDIDKPNDSPDPNVSVIEAVTPIPIKKPSAPKKQDPPSSWSGIEANSKKTTVKKKSTEDEFIRVNLNKIERLNNYVGELILLQTVLEQRRFVTIRDELANKSISQLSKISKEIQDISMSMRLVPLKSTFQKMNRIVRDTSKTLGKNVSLILEGEETEIDKTILESVIDPLVHVIRNAVDHGVESPEDRMQSGKTPNGSVWLRALHQGGHLVIEVKDDGKGIDSEVIYKKAVEKSIIKPDQNMAEKEIIQLLFHPGFSTKEQVTEVSGRGVGMDVVKTNIQSLGGEVELSTVKGQGSTCRIQLPLTLAIIDGMIASVESERYIFPLTQISEFFRPTEDNISYVTGVGNCLSLRGEVMPIFDLSEDLQRGASRKSILKAICVVGKMNGKKYAVRVDDILNQQQIVVKSLAPDIRNQTGFMGGSILGDGQPAFIIDLEELYKDRLLKFKNSSQKSLGA